jgi:hypothetical protein
MSETRIRWSPEEWHAVTAHAAPLLARGKAPLAAMMAAQRAVLSKSRRRDEESVRHSLAPSGAGGRYLEEARKMLPEPPPELPKPERRKRTKLDEGRNYARQPGSNVMWTKMEWARIARWVAQRRDEGDTRALSRLIIEAQEVVLDVDRRRPVTSIQAGGSAGSEDREGINGRMYQEGLTKIWLLPADEPEKQPEPEVHAQPEETPQEAAQAEAAPIPLPVRREGVSEAAKAFGETVMQALDVLLTRHTETLLGQVEARVAASAQAMGVQVAAMIERGMRETVHRIVEVELGGPVAPTLTGEAPAPAEVPQAQPASEPEEPKRLKVDVVGFEHGDNVERVRAAFNGNTDLRFVHPDNWNTYAPHRNRHVILMVGRVPHSLSKKIKASGVEPLIVKKTAGHVIHAIEELQRAAGFTPYSASGAAH